MKKVYFIGIGGIGMSALARYFLSQHWPVSGSDNCDTEIIDDLRRFGINIAIGVNPKNIKRDNDLVVYTAAIKSDHAELKQTKVLGIKTKSYAEALGDFTKKHWTIAVSGSHGKSTTTALISLILIKAGLDPTVIIGTKLKEFGNSNFRLGKSKYLIIEADEWNKSFLNYWPQMVILTNIDKEHLDTYGSQAGVVENFKKYLNHIPKDGYLIANWQDRNSKKAAEGAKCRVIFYNKNKMPRHKLNIPGRHNQLNAEAAWQGAKILGIKKDAALQVFGEYQGAWRRFEKLKPNIYSDYAHHPTEIKATLNALRRKHSKQKIICIFQPHQADRLTRLFPDFKNAFAGADKIILLPVYKPKGRELLVNEKTSLNLYMAIKNKYDASYCDSFKGIKKYLNISNQKNILVFMSAGDLDSWLRRELSHFEWNKI